MKPKLEFTRSKSFGNILAFIVDASNSAGYPSNFVCVLPAILNKDSGFARIFGKEHKKLALQLLSEALENPECRDNGEVRAEIEKRIAYLSAKPLVTAKCKECGET